MTRLDRWVADPALTASVGGPEFFLISKKLLDVSGPCFDRLNEDLHGPYSPTPP